MFYHTIFLCPNIKVLKKYVIKIHFLTFCFYLWLFWLLLSNGWNLRPFAPWLYFHKLKEKIDTSHFINEDPVQYKINGNGKRWNRDCLSKVTSDKLKVFWKKVNFENVEFMSFWTYFEWYATANFNALSAEGKTIFLPDVSSPRNNHQLIFFIYSTQRQLLSLQIQPCNLIDFYTYFFIIMMMFLVFVSTVLSNSVIKLNFNSYKSF